MRGTKCSNLSGSNVYSLYSAKAVRTPCGFHKRFPLFGIPLVSWNNTKRLKNYTVCTLRVGIGTLRYNDLVNDP